MKFVDFITPNTVCADLESTAKMDVLAELSQLLARVCTRSGPAEITKVLIDRERLATTGVGEGVAIPHGKTDSVDQICAAVGVSRTGIPFDSVDGQPVHIFVALLAPQGSSGEHLKALARVSKILKDPAFRSRLLESKTSEELYNAILEEDGKY